MKGMEAKPPKFREFQGTPMTRVSTLLEMVTANTALKVVSMKYSVAKSGEKARVASWRNVARRALPPSHE